MVIVREFPDYFDEEEGEFQEEFAQQDSYYRGQVNIFTFCAGCIDKVGNINNNIR